MQNFQVSEYINSLCEVLTEENRLLFVGVISDYDDKTKKIRVELRRGAATPQGVIFNTKVKLRLNSTKGKRHIVLFCGIIAQCANDYWIIEWKDTVSYEEGRESFRQPVRANGLIHKIEDLSSQEKDIPCRLVDISLTGVGFQSKGLYELGENLELSIDHLCENGAGYSLCCTVVRREDPKQQDDLPPVYKYGCSFFSLSEREEDRLYRDILNLQQQSLNSKRMKGY